MELMKITAKVDSHYINQQYKTLIIDLTPYTKPGQWIHYDLAWNKKRKWNITVNGHKVDVATMLKMLDVKIGRINMVPTNEWLMQVVQGMVDWKPSEFYPLLRTAVLMGDFETGEWR